MKPESCAEANFLQSLPIRHLVLSKNLKNFAPAIGADRLFFSDFVGVITDSSLIELISASQTFKNLVLFNHHSFPFEL
jgi:hypothetical protein